MGQVREHLLRDDHAMAQWIFRKLCNHDPMKKRDKARGITNRGSRTDHKEGTSVVQYDAGGKLFLIEVQEVDSFEKVAG